MVATAVPQCSKRQWIASALWALAAILGLALFMRRWNLSLNRSDDWLTPIESFVRLAGLMFGWTFMWIGVIPLIATRRHVHVLTLVLAATIAGGVAGVLYHLRFGSGLPEATGLIGAILCPVIIVAGLCTVDAWGESAKAFRPSPAGRCNHHMARDH